MTADERISIEMHSIESRFVIGHQIYCLQACMCAFLSPEILQAGAVNGLNILHVGNLFNFMKTHLVDHGADSAWLVLEPASCIKWTIT